MILAVTGATGFLGRHFVAAAQSQGHAVRALVGAQSAAVEMLKRQGVVVVPGRLAHRKSAAKLLEGAEVLVHLAALGVQSRDRDWARTVQVNVVQPLLLVEEAARARVRRVVAAGTCLEYAGRGQLPSSMCPEDQRVPLDEDAPLEPRDAYGASKAAGGTLLRALARERGVALWYLRIASLYGPGDDPVKLLPSAATAAVKRMAFEMSAGEQIREWLHCGDAADALLRAAEREPPGEVAVANVGTGKGLSTRELVRELFERCGASPELLHIGARPYRAREPHYVVMRCERARRWLGFSPRVGLPDGLAGLADAERAVT